MSDVKIEAKDLMIGNWVMVEGRPLQVLKIDSLNEHFGKKGTITVKQYVGDAHVSDFSKWVEDARPIPLDPTILEKCGFVKEVHQAQYNFFGYRRDNMILYRVHSSATSEDWFYEVEYGETYEDRQALSIRLDYLHELQNLCTLIKQPLKIEL